MDRSFPTIGVAIIARNSSATIGKALCSVRPIAAQIVVVDTGSTDATATIATRLGAEVYFHRWTDDFSAARNHALRYLRTNWVLVLDSDEALDIPSLSAERHLLTHPHIGGIEVSIASVLGSGGAYHEHRYTRIFRRSPDICFEGKVHEQIAPSILAAGFEIVPSSIRIVHEGYRELNPEKIARNVALLEAELAADPESVWHRYHLGLAEFARGNLHRARQLLDAVRISHQLSEAQRELATIRCAQCALATDDLLGAEKLLAFTSPDQHREGLRLFVLAGVLAAQQQFHAAAELLSMAPVCHSGLVEQDHRAAFVERLSELARYHRTPDPLETVWNGKQRWQAIFR
ncbi:MAG: glycosyltransferase family 2 protein [Chlorobi bacterium]|nr:glycosyltransferase family 2 protein [Chlorobiota bacterium]